MKPREGFTLVEVLIVVIILGILAVMVIPQFASASASARSAMLLDDLRLMRSQLMVFKAQHGGVSAGYPEGDTSQSPTADAFSDHVLLSSNPLGQTAEVRSAEYRYGPYMREFPENPINGKSTVLILGDAAEIPAAASDQYGWIYQPSTLTFKADCTGSDETGKTFFSY